MSEADRGLLQYASLVAGMGMTNEVRFVHVITPVRAEATSATPANAHRAMETAVEEHFGALHDDVSVECHVIEGARIDRIVEFSSRRRRT